MELIVSLPASHEVSSRHKSVTVSIEKLTPEIVAKLAIHGLTQKIADAAAGAPKAAGFEGRKTSELSESENEKVSDFGKALMQKVVDALENGDWGREKSGNGVDVLTSEIRSLLLPKVKATFTKESWKTLSDDEKTAAIDAAFEKQTDETKAKITTAAQTEIERKLAAKKAASALEIDI